ncbi:MAG: DUF5672 family protein [Candidatus Magasanikbacteria bacterium]
MKKVAIVVPTYKKDLNEDEKISLRHLLHFLGSYDIFYMAPDGLTDLNYHKFPTVFFPKKYFKSVMTYSKLMLKKEFYQKFSEYEYILIYQFDVLVFSDQLNEWCEKGYDYVGAPWFKSQIPAYSHEDACGNGGFSLRNVSKALEVIEKSNEPLLVTSFKFLKQLVSLVKIRSLKSWLRGFKEIWSRSTSHRSLLAEDYYWSFEAKNFVPDFKIPDVDTGLKFAFETGPKYCFERNNYQLPFGCHAWAKHDKNFWLSYIIPETNKKV